MHITIPITWWSICLVIAFCGWLVGRKEDELGKGVVFVVTCVAMLGVTFGYFISRFLT